MLLISLKFGTDAGTMSRRSSLMNQMLPTTLRFAEVFPSSTRMRKTRLTRKQKEVKSAKYSRVRVAFLTVVFERVLLRCSEGEVCFSEGEVVDWSDRWRQEEMKLGKAIALERRARER